jgi:hypothetical protein
MVTKLTVSQNQLLALSKPSTLELVKILSAEDEFELTLFESKMTVAQAMEGTSLKKLSQVLNTSGLAKTLVFLIQRLSNNFNVGKKFTNEQAVILAMDLIEVFAYETIEDVLLMFKYARIGKIGSGKEYKLDSQTVFHKWVPEYLELKSEERENLHKKEKGLMNAKPTWSKEDAEKFVVSPNTEILTTKDSTLGKRTKERLATPEQTSPVVNRISYLKALAYEASKTPTENLNNLLQYLEEKNEQDAIAVIKKALQNRQQ